MCSSRYHGSLRASSSIEHFIGGASLLRFFCVRNIRKSSGAPPSCRAKTQMIIFSGDHLNNRTHLHPKKGRWSREGFRDEVPCRSFLGAASIRNLQCVFCRSVIAACGHLNGPTTNTHPILQHPLLRRHQRRRPPWMRNTHIRQRGDSGTKVVTYKMTISAWRTDAVS